MKYYDAKLKSKKYLVEGILDVQLEVENSYTFTVGQFCYVKVDGEITRPYSIVKFEKGNLHLLIDCRNPGKGSDYFSNIQIGWNVPISKAVGKFQLEKSDSKSNVFVATGTGIAPLIPMILASENKNIEIIFGVKEPEFVNILEFYLQNQINNFNVTICTTSKIDNIQEHIFRGRVTTFLESKLDGYFLEKDFYVSGRNTMIKDVKRILKVFGVKKIFLENYG